MHNADHSSGRAHSPDSGQVRKRVLIVHQNFPGQFRHIALHLLGRSDVEAVGLGRDTAPGLPGFPWFKYKLHREVKPEAHPYLRQMESAVLHGQAVARAMTALKARGFVPDVILAHPGWGETLYAREVFPQARLIHFCEWFYSTSGADFDFDPEFPPTFDDKLRVTTWNALHLLNLENCDAAITPTAWQQSRHPAAYMDKIQLVHEGIDTANLKPDPQAELTLRPIAVDGEAARRVTVRAGEPVITYVARNLEPYRGFHTFMRALPAVLSGHPKAQVVIVGGDGRSYGSLPKDAAHWREYMLREVGPDLGADRARVHFLGKVPYDEYKKVLQVSAAHVYLTYPFVLSWSLLEAMASGCRIVASDTAPVREVIRDGESGELVDFFDPAALSRKLLAALADPAGGDALRRNARQVAQRYSLAAGLAEYLRSLGLSAEGGAERSLAG